MMRRGIASLAVVLMLAACGTAAQTPTPSVVPTTTALPPTETPAPQATMTPMLVGDAAEGARLFKTFQPAAGIACSTCHRIDSDDRLIGPGLLHVAERAKTRVEGVNQTDYIHTSIVDPDAYIVAGYPDIMPKNWGQVFTEAQIDDLIAYLLSL